MPTRFKSKVGIVACSGEETAGGTVTRLAALRVLEQLRPHETVTICLPLFLAGGAGDRAFARLHPTITVDGCDQRCAARATAQHSGPPAASLVVDDIVRECGLAPPQGRRRLNDAGRQAVEATAARVAELVDQLLDRPGTAQPAPPAVDAPADEVDATCACGSGVPVTKLRIGGELVEVLALPLILRELRDAGRGADDGLADEILSTVKIYNAVPPENEAAYRTALLRAYADLCEREPQA